MLTLLSILWPAIALAADEEEDRPSLMQTSWALFWLGDADSIVKLLGSYERVRAFTDFAEKWAGDLVATENPSSDSIDRWGEAWDHINAVFYECRRTGMKEQWPGIPIGGIRRPRTSFEIRETMNHQLRQIGLPKSYVDEFCGNLSEDLINDSLRPVWDYENLETNDRPLPNDPRISSLTRMLEHFARNNTIEGSDWDDYRKSLYRYLLEAILYGDTVPRWETHSIFAQHREELRQILRKKGWPTNIIEDTVHQTIDGYYTEWRDIPWPNYSAIITEKIK
jgi:hypothetical protein